MTESRDKQLARQQALMLDAVGPMTFILEGAVKGQLNHKSAIKRHRLQYASSAILMPQSMEAGKGGKMLFKSMNTTRLLDMADDDAISWQPHLSLGMDGFCNSRQIEPQIMKGLFNSSK